MVYEKLTNNDSALLFYRLSYAINKLIDDKYGMVYDEYNIGNVLIKLNRQYEAEPYVRRSLALATELNLPTEIAYSQLLLGSMFVSQSREKEGIPLLESVLNNGQEYMSMRHRYDAYQSLYLAYKQQGHAEKTLQYLELYKMLEDSLRSDKVAKQLNELEAQYQAEKKGREILLLNADRDRQLVRINSLQAQEKIRQLELSREREKRRALWLEKVLMDSIVAKEKINNDLLARENSLKAAELKSEAAVKASLSKENELKKAQLKSERTLRSGLIIAATLLACAALLIFLLYRTQRNKNAVIRKQSEDVQVLMKEIHHRVKNNLQVISSLLDLQSMTISDNQASEAVKEGKNRVQSMALIHQKLYSEGNISGIRSAEYINHLLNNLSASYNINKEKVEVHTDIDDLTLDVDTMIPIGLVLNELVSNSFKYAFNDGRKGQLSILLQQRGTDLLLRVQDNGVGYPSGLNVKDGKSFGMKMIRAFSQKLKAKLDIYNDHGAVTQMLISKYNLV